LQRLALPLAFAVAGVAAVGLIAGDPRAARTLDGSDRIVFVAALLAAAVGTVAWRVAGRSGWWLPPALLLALVGALLGWTAGVRLGGDYEEVAHLGSATGQAIALVVMTAGGMAVPPTIYAAAIRTRVVRSRAG
jgi:hypothetical protein